VVNTLAISVVVDGWSETLFYGNASALFSIDLHQYPNGGPPIPIGSPNMMPSILSKASRGGMILDPIQSRIIVTDAFGLQIWLRNNYAASYPLISSPGMFVQPVGLTADHLRYSFYVTDKTLGSVWQIPMCDVAALAHITFSTGTLQPFFSPGVLNYTLLIDARVQQVYVGAAAAQIGPTGLSDIKYRVGTGISLPMQKQNRTFVNTPNYASDLFNVVGGTGIPNIVTIQSTTERGVMTEYTVYLSPRTTVACTPPSVVPGLTGDTFVSQTYDPTTQTMYVLDALWSKQPTNPGRILIVPLNSSSSSAIRTMQLPTHLGPIKALTGLTLDVTSQIMYLFDQSSNIIASSGYGRIIAFPVGYPSVAVELMSVVGISLVTAISKPIFCPVTRVIYFVGTLSTSAYMYRMSIYNIFPPTVDKRLLFASPLAWGGTSGIRTTNATPLGWVLDSLGQQIYVLTSSSNVSPMDIWHGDIAGWTGLNAVAPVTTDAVPSLPNLNSPLGSSTQGVFMPTGWPQFNAGNPIPWISIQRVGVEYDSVMQRLLVGTRWNIVSIPLNNPDSLHFLPLPIGTIGFAPSALTIDPLRGTLMALESSGITLTLIPLCEDASVNLLEFDMGELQPPFSPELRNYTLLVNARVTSVRFMAANGNPANQTITFRIGSNGPYQSTLPQAHVFLASTNWMSPPINVTSMTGAPITLAIRAWSESGKISADYLVTISIANPVACLLPSPFTSLSTSIVSGTVRPSVVYWRQTDSIYNFDATSPTTTGFNLIQTRVGSNNLTYAANRMWQFLSSTTPIPFGGGDGFGTAGPTIGFRQLTIDQRAGVLFALDLASSSMRLISFSLSRPAAGWSVHMQFNNPAPIVIASQPVVSIITQVIYIGLERLSSPVRGIFRFNMHAAVVVTSGVATPLTLTGGVTFNSPITALALDSFAQILYATELGGSRVVRIVIDNSLLNPMCSTTAITLPLGKYTVSSIPSFLVYDAVSQSLFATLNSTLATSLLARIPMDGSNITNALQSAQSSDSWTGLSYSNGGPSLYMYNNTGLWRIAIDCIQSNNASLLSLTLEPTVQLVPAFSPTRFEYSANFTLADQFGFLFSLSQAQLPGSRLHWAFDPLQPYAQHPESFINSVDNIDQPSVVYTQRLSSAHTLVLRIIAEDGITSTFYRVNVTRQLIGLTASFGSFTQSFDINTFTYSSYPLVPGTWAGTFQVKFTFGASIAVYLNEQLWQAKLAANTNSLPIPFDDDTASLVTFVTPSNNYTVNVTVNARVLHSIQLSALQWNGSGLVDVPSTDLRLPPSFMSTFTANVSYILSSITVRLNYTANGILRIRMLSTSGGSSYVNANSTGVDNAFYPLIVGTNLMQIDSSIDGTYNVTIVRADTDVTSVQFVRVDTNIPVAFSFMRHQFYTALSVPYAVSDINVVVAFSVSTVSVNTGGVSMVATSLIPIQIPISLSVVNRILVTSSLDGEYIFDITRSDATLSAILLRPSSGGSSELVWPSFDPTLHYYNVTVPLSALGSGGIPYSICMLSATTDIVNVNYAAITLAITSGNAGGNFCFDLHSDMTTKEGNHTVSFTSADNGIFIIDIITPTIPIESSSSISSSSSSSSSGSSSSSSSTGDSSSGESISGNSDSSSSSSGDLWSSSSSSAMDNSTISISSSSTGVALIYIDPPVIAFESHALSLSFDVSLTLTVDLITHDSITQLTDLHFQWHCTLNGAPALWDDLGGQFVSKMSRVTTIDTHSRTLYLPANSITVAGMYVFTATILDTAPGHVDSAGAPATGSVSTTVTVSEPQKLSIIIPTDGAFRDPCLDFSPCVNGGQCVATAHSGGNTFSLSCICPTSPYVFYGQSHALQLLHTPIRYFHIALTLLPHLDVSILLLCFSC
jgi:uncharacterized membrane protein YgcG